MIENSYKRQVAVIGAGDCTTKEYETAFELGRSLASLGIIIICGGLGGVMEAVCKGAKDADGTTVGILPGEQIEANSYVDIPIVTAMSHARNNIVVRSGECVVAVGGGYGTLSEIAIAIKLGKPVIGINTWTVSDEIMAADSHEEAISLIKKTLEIE